MQPSQGSIPLHRQHPPPQSPHQNYQSPNVTKNRLPRANHSPYPQVGIAPNGQPSPESFYTGSPYATQGVPAPSPQYSSAGSSRARPAWDDSQKQQTDELPEASEMMTAGQMQPRPYHLYTPQSHSPASTVSSHGQDPPNRLYSQPPQMQNPMYYPSYNMGHMPQQQHSHSMMTPPQSTVPQHQNPPMMPHPQSTLHSPAMNNSPRLQQKFEPQPPRPLESIPLKSPPSQMSSSHPSSKAPSQNGENVRTGSGAAPGPIPATTPVVVRQDSDGVQSIAFEYSRDRVKMEYQIRCNVESVDTTTLSKEFKEANCVYPRAFCEKDKYTGNRFNYETECNTVGWALAQLNESLREKRGLIQRAVDSWRNSNQDSRLRSRRVRRQHKNNNRKSQQPSSAPASREPSIPSNVMMQQRPLPQALSSAVPTQIYPHPSAVESGLAGHPEAPGMNHHFESHHAQDKSHQAQGLAQIRPAHVFHGYPSAYPLQPNHPTGLSVPPLHTGLDSHLAPHPSTTISASTMPPASSAKAHASSPSMPPKDLKSIYPKPHDKKFINVHNPGQEHKTIRVTLDLREAKIHEAPDDFRERNSVYPRSYFPHSMPLTADDKRQKRVANRFADIDVDDTRGFEVGQTTVKIPTIDGVSEAPVPRLSRRFGKQDEMMNDAGYRISWPRHQLPKYDRKILVLQRSREP